MANVKDSWNDLIAKLNGVIKRGSEKPEYFQMVHSLFDEL